MCFNFVMWGNCKNDIVNSDNVQEALNWDLGEQDLNPHLLFSDYVIQSLVS